MAIGSRRRTQAAGSSSELWDHRIVSAFDGQLKAADRPVLEEGATTCCYAKSEKSWIADPDGIVWEAFFTSGEATVYGDSPAPTRINPNAATETCCAPAGAAAPA
ncbi:VOC family protein [Sphingomonas parva]|uniref:hypothetical protein n=1 Tax=Sphingomonas parva TaxID=2555898 RepID=UPI00384D54F4